MLGKSAGGDTVRGLMPLRWIIYITLAFLPALAGCSRGRRAVSANAELMTPVLAVASLEAGTLFFNAPALAWLPADRPERSRAAAFAQAAQDPRLFRKLDRELRFASVWLCGDPSQFKPLLEHLLETKDFGLSYLDHTSLVFRRGGATWETAKLEALRARFPVASEQAAFLAQAASRLLAIRQPEPARHCLEEAEKLDAAAPEVWSGWSSWRMARGEFPAAIEAADRALALDPDFLPALACKTQILYASKKFSDAYDLSERLLERAPDDPGTLFYHAKIAHEAHAYDAEIRTMKHLIELAARGGASVSGYRIYLGQAYAAKSDAENAMDQLSLALIDTELPREQRQFADELFNQIKERTPPK